MRAQHAMLPQTATAISLCPAPPPQAATSGPRREVVLSERMVRQSEGLGKVKVGDVVPGVVVGVTDYGAFIDLDGLPGVTGLVHRSELSWDVFLSVDQVVQNGKDFFMF